MSTQSKKKKLTKKVNTLPSSASKAKSELCFLSPCAMKYARCLANPFTGPEACIPSFPAVLSKKVRVFAKGVFTTSSTTNIGFILLTPTNFIANNLGGCFTTDSTFAGTAFTNAGTGVINNGSNSEYSAASFGSGVTLAKYRMVSAGIRVRYIGTNLNLGGQLVAYQDPDHQSLITRTITDIDGETESRRLPYSRDKWSKVLYRPAYDEENNFQAVFPPIAGATQFMGIITESAVASQPFEWETFAVFEVIGRNVRAKTLSEVDPAGYAAVHTASLHPQNLLPNQVPPEQQEQSMVKASNTSLTSHQSNPPESQGFDWGKVAVDVLSFGAEFLLGLL
jgi:hypothetical protein